jgi:hypothetical protein
MPHLQWRAPSEFGASSDATLQIATVRQRLTKLGLEPLPMSREQFTNTSWMKSRRA